MRRDKRIIITRKEGTKDTFEVKRNTRQAGRIARFRLDDPNCKVADEGLNAKLIADIYKATEEYMEALEEKNRKR